jgi:hypothetical protein
VVALRSSRAGLDCCRNARAARELARETYSRVVALGATVGLIDTWFPSCRSGEAAHPRWPRRHNDDLLLRGGWLDTDLEPAIERPAGSQVVIWGYSRLEDPQLYRLFRLTRAAREFAAECGWDSEHPGAWAREFLSIRGLHQTLIEVEPLVREDPAVAGWGGRILRDPIASVRHQQSGQPPGKERAPLHDRSTRPSDRLGALATAVESQRAEMRLRMQEARQLHATLQRQLTELQRGARRVLLCADIKAGRGARHDGRAASEAIRDPVLRMGISAEAFEALNGVISQALSMAESGRLADGYSLLLEGMHQAAERSSWDDSWGSEVVGVYALALENYAARFGVRME